MTGDMDPLDMERHRQSLNFGYVEPPMWDEDLVQPPEATPDLNRIVGTYIDLADFGWDLWSGEGMDRLMPDVPPKLLPFMTVDIEKYTRQRASDYDIYKNSEGVYLVCRKSEQPEAGE